LGTSQDKIGEPTSLDSGYASAIYTFCIDKNGKEGPNEPGVDVFFTNFQHRADGKSFFHAGRINNDNSIVASKQAQDPKGQYIPPQPLLDDAPGGKGLIEFKKGGTKGTVGELLIER